MLLSLSDSDWFGLSQLTSNPCRWRGGVGAYARCTWAEGTCASFPDFCDNRQFHVIILCYLSFMYFISKNFWFTIHVVSWFWRIIDQICGACAIFCPIPNLQAHTGGQTDGRINLEEPIPIGYPPQPGLIHLSICPSVCPSVCLYVCPYGPAD